MKNEVFDSLSETLRKYLGAPSPLDSGTGVRFKSEGRGKATVYHSNVAAGNKAEVAFHTGSMAKRLRMTVGEFSDFVARLSASTGRPVEMNEQFNWPRVGVASDDHVMLIREAFQKRMGGKP